MASDRWLRTSRGALAGMKNSSMGAPHEGSIHKTECTKNYEGSAGGMEPHGMLIGFRRSESLHKLNYTGYLGDGDSKSHANVVSADPPVYTGKTVTKLERRKKCFI